MTLDRNQTQTTHSTSNSHFHFCERFFDPVELCVAKMIADRIIGSDLFRMQLLAFLIGVDNPCELAGGAQLCARLASMGRLPQRSY
jgi:hypothetical protein